ncbi:Structure-specific endonuclease subunit SLX4 [Daldinia childiae]|uniref:Structure-specific endonuclease subunit SLX4 n=1 Tax=Daldinia childiae TaxID=326645 RepID=UPI0014469450|nr:Structure-specific endonuclease subunit SLX4 [Daldinia childiae]KAF3069818.1 Structure-specific endonuclease subunit SLX4 [Daldinia childiae]
MSTADVFLSSPAPPTRVNPYDLSSSPDLPPINEIFSNNPKKPSLRSASHTPPIPDDARTTFTSAADLLREAPEIDIETEQITNSPPQKSRANKANKKRTPTPESVNALVETPILIQSSQEKPWQKFKSKKSTSQSEQPPITKARVTKQTTKGKQKGKTDTVSKHFPAKEGVGKRADEKSDNGIVAQKLDDQITNDLHCSEPALRRRRDWTPPPPNDPILLESESDSRELHSSVDRGSRSKDVFDTLLDRYGCKDTTSSATLERLQQSGTLVKRMSIEPVSTGVDIGQRPRETSPAKVVNTKKKKTRTITELATAPYMPLMNPELDLTGLATKESLLNYFDEDGVVKALVDQQTIVMTQKKGKAKETKAPAKPKRKKKSGTMDNPILLSPNSALKQSSNQDFVFGTSSQLAREESPTTLRDLQLAIRASNQVDSDPFADSDSQGLWHASSRDTDGELMKIDDVELVRTLPSLSRIQERQQYSDEGFVDINDILKSSDIEESIITPPQNSDLAVSSAQPPQTDSEEPIELTAETSNPRPDFELLNDSQLAKQIASYGFKPVKKRQAMIALLDQCWVSKNPGVSIVHTNSISTSSSSSAPKRKQATTAPQPENPPKRRGRPRKNSVAEASTSKAAAPKATTTKKPRGRSNKDTLKSVEIADSDLDEFISSSSRESSPERDRIFSSPPAVDLSLSDETDLSLTMSPTDQQAGLFRHITKAVTSAPRSQDPSQPSWYEKMLLYDPIILEDLAAWLNAGALNGAGYDGEVSPVDVKKWCESKSVICLWRQNMRGKERKRY